MVNEGYEGKAAELLKKHGVGIWHLIELKTEKGTVIKGLVLPAPEGTTNEIFIKLPNGYNIAINVSKITHIASLGVRKVEYKIKGEPLPSKLNLPNVLLLGVGGTIASRIEYATGAVKPAFSQQELLNAVPELAEIANIETESIFNIFSEDMKPSYWIRLAKKIADRILDDPDVNGFILTHGTDTMQYTAAALTFMLDNLPTPIVLTGAQRSSDRPASDSAVNLIASTLVASMSDIGEPVIVMHASLDDTKCYANRGTRVRKMHSSRRDAFKTIGDDPIAEVDVVSREIRYINTAYIKTNKKRDEFQEKAVFEEKTSMVYIYPGIDKDIIENLIDRGYRGIVLIGTGLGHVPDYLLSSISRGVEEGTFFVMTTQCIWGPVAMNVYERGRRLQKIGVIPGDGMLPEVAYVKLGWLLAQTDDKNEVKKLMTTNLRNEILRREKVDRYVC